jgi:indole-3-glycerol phosphate synthase
MPRKPTDLQNDFLVRMTARSRERAAAARARLPDAEMRARARDRAPASALRLAAAGFDLIAEVKRRSPSQGQLAGDQLDPVAQAAAYADAGAAALSVLTEPEEFHGTLADLEAVAGAVAQVPAMRKDFLVDPYQIWEARAAGAGGVLLVAACLDRDLLQRLLEDALELGLFTLVEVFDERDLEHCLPVMDAAGPAVQSGAVRMLLGVNCRDLRSLRVDFGRFAELAPRLPATYPKVAESGVVEPGHAAAVVKSGYDLALVGTALMRAADPVAAAQALLSAGREV